MEPNATVSKTALMVCAYRARATDTMNALCSDPWARDLAGDDGLAISQAFDQRFHHMELWIALRTAYLDAHVRHWTSAEVGMKQVVLLGAGFDTRADRLAAPGVRFFEVDHPATQAEKRRRLQRLEKYPANAAIYARCNFEQDDFVERLEAVGFDSAAPAVILWEGVTPYLTEEAIRSTTSKIADTCHRESVLIFDFVSKEMAQGTVTGLDKETADFVDELAEPIRFGSNDVLPLLADSGFRYTRIVNFDEICLSLTGIYNRDHKFRFQQIAVASKTVHSLL